jgi:hypothetical protein
MSLSSALVIGFTLLSPSDVAKQTPVLEVANHRIEQRVEIPRVDYGRVDDGVRIYPAEDQMLNPTNPFLFPIQNEHQQFPSSQDSVMPECHHPLEPTELEPTKKKGNQEAYREDSQGI